MVRRYTWMLCVITLCLLSLGLFSTPATAMPALSGCSSAFPQDDEDAPAGNSDDQDEDAPDGNSDDQDEDAPDGNSDDQDEDAPDGNSDDQDEDAPDGNSDDADEDAPDGNSDDGNSDAPEAKPDGDGKGNKADSKDTDEDAEDEEAEANDTSAFKPKTGSLSFLKLGLIVAVFLVWVGYVRFDQSRHTPVWCQDGSTTRSVEPHFGRQLRDRVVGRITGANLLGWFPVLPDRCARCPNHLFLHAPQPS